MEQLRLALAAKVVRHEVFALGHLNVLSDQITSEAPAHRMNTAIEN